MIVLRPEIVRFESFAWEDVLLVAVERVGTRIVEEHGDAGPHAAFVDVPEQSIHIRVQRAIGVDDLDDPALGTAGVLVFYGAPPADDRRRQRITIACVVVGIRSEPGAGGRPPAKTIAFRAVSSGGSDPVTIGASGASEA
ncbi:MAG TPA: hypothetical protein PKE29_06410 [Phycisphaerales bacterium]|nr:hypothetical protein [Phycisphaerales bacterium]